MFHWLRQRAMTGGVVFGPPAWSPSRIESTFDVPGNGKIAASTPLPEAPLPSAPTASTPSPPPAPDFKNRRSHIRGPGILPPAFHHLPHNRRDLADLLESFKINRTSCMIPALSDQLRHLDTSGGEHRPRALVLNLLPAQPEFALGAALLQIAREDLHAGLHAICEILRPRAVLAVFDRHDRGTRRALRQLAHRNDYPLTLHPLLNRYPQAHPTILMRTLWGKRLQVDALPSRFGRIMIDAVTPWAFGRFLRTREPLSDRPVQLFMQQDKPQDGRPFQPRLLSALIGESISSLAGRYGVHLAGRQIILNGMLAGTTATADTRIQSDTESISLRLPVAVEGTNPCISCGWCVDVCPTGLVPLQLLELNGRVPSGAVAAPGTRSTTAPAPDPAKESAPHPAPRGRLARESLHCIGCGLCSYVCPTRLPLMRETLSLRLRVIAAGHGPPGRHADSPQQGGAA